MATLELIPDRLHMYAHGPDWCSWTIGGDWLGSGLRLTGGPWHVELNWQRWTRRRWDTMPAEERQQVLAEMAADYGWTDEQLAMASRTGATDDH